MDDQLKLELSILLVVIIMARIAFLVHKISTGHSSQATTKRKTPCKTIICIGSGGHTTEMLQLLQGVNLNNYSPRYYFLAKSDTTSQMKIEEFERKFGSISAYKIVRIPRSRIVHQSYLTSILTTIWSILYCFPLICKMRPDLVICNGPGTCIPICGISFLLKCAFITDTRIVFVESYCRVKSFSLTGKILMYLADNFLVQWPQLKRKLKRSDYIGQLM